MRRSASSTLSLHDALPICHADTHGLYRQGGHPELRRAEGEGIRSTERNYSDEIDELQGRSEEHTSELQSHVNLVCRPLLEKKKKKAGEEATGPTRSCPWTP